MEGFRKSQYLRSGMTVFLTAVFLFGYANATLFWHRHLISGNWICHSHISGPAHRSAPDRASHSPAQLLLIMELDQAVFTEGACVPYYPEPFWTLIAVLRSDPVLSAGFPSVVHNVLRGPPALV